MVPFTHSVHNLPSNMDIHILINTILPVLWHTLNHTGKSPVTLMTYPPGNWPLARVLWHLWPHTLSPGSWGRWHWQLCPCSHGECACGECKWWGGLEGRGVAYILHIRCVCMWEKGRGIHVRRGVAYMWGGVWRTWIKVKWDMVGSQVQGPYDAG